MGRFPLSYSWATPGADYSAQSVWANRAPTTQDFDNWFIGAIWIDESTYVAGTKDPEVWMLVRKDNHSALWIRFYGGGTGLETITGDTGGAVPPDATDTIFLNSGIVGLSFDGTPGSHLIELNSSAGEPLFQGLRGDNAIEVYPTPAGYIDTIGTAGQIAVDEDPLNNTMIWSLEGPVATSYVTDAGTAIPAVNILNILGGTLVNTAGAGNTVTINADGEVLSTVTTDAGVATPVANNLNVLAGENTNTSAAGDTVRVHLNRNIRWPATNAAGTEGVIYIDATCDGTSCAGGNYFLHMYTPAGVPFSSTNLFLGRLAGNFTCTSVVDINVGIGAWSLTSLTSGCGNTGLGDQTLALLTTGCANTAVGDDAALKLINGSYNTIIGGNFTLGGGTGAGYNYTSNESHNIIINNAGTTGDNNTIRIGTNGAGTMQQDRCFIAGIRGQTTGVADAVAVLIDSAHQLGTISSSRKYKTNIEDMGDQSSIIFKLRPVTFNFKEHPTVPAWGLIAEEVAEVFPQLAVYDKETGEPETVKYHDLPVLLLNELQKQKKEVDETRQLLKNMRDRVRILEEQISLLLQKKGDL